MKSRIGGVALSLACFVIAAQMFFAARCRGAEERYLTNTIPLIVMDSVPLNDAIKNLARQAGLNYILDPRFTASGVARHGVDLRWENITAQNALTRLLKQYDLTMIKSPVTDVTRIGFTNMVSHPVDAGVLGAEPGTNAVIPMIVMDDVPLDAALNNLAKESKVNLIVDLDNATPPGFMPPVSLRWEDMTGRKAIVALCEAYGLVLVKDPSNDTVRVKIRDKKK